MPNRLRIALTVLAVFAANPARAQSSFGIALGPSLPMGDLATVDGTGYHVMLMAQNIPPEKAVGFRFEGGYNAFRRKGTIQQITERVIYGSASVVLRPLHDLPAHPYLVGGFGMYNQDTSPRPISASSATEIGYNLGAGTRFGVGRRTAFAELHYHKIMTESGASFAPLSIGLIF